MESRRDCTWILSFPGFRLETIEGQHDEATSRLRVHVERRGRRYPCSGCGRCTSRVRSMKDRTWDDLPWAAHPVTVVYRQRRVKCRRCGIRTERIEFADAKARVTRRLRQQIVVDCQSMPTSHAAVRHAVSVVFDKFHVLQHASAALDDVRRQELFRAGAVMREHGRGKRWLLLRRWKTVRGSKRVELQTLFAAIDGCSKRMCCASNSMAMLRRARGMRDEQILLLKLK